MSEVKPTPNPDRPAEEPEFLPLAPPAAPPDIYHEPFILARLKPAPKAPGRKNDRQTSFL